MTARTCGGRSGEPPSRRACGAAHGYAVQHDAGVRADGADESADPAQVVEVIEPANADVASAAIAVRAVVRHEDVEPARAVIAREVAHQRCVCPVPVNEDDRAVSLAGVRERTAREAVCRRAR